MIISCVCLHEVSVLNHFVVCLKPFCCNNNRLHVVDHLPMKCSVYYILVKGICVAMNFCMDEQSMNHIFLEKKAVMQSHPLCRTCMYQVSTAALGDLEMGTATLCTKHSQVAGVLPIGMVTAYYCYFFLL